MRVLVTGGREYNNMRRVFDALDKVHDSVGVTEVVHGACCDKMGNLKGADGLSEKWAISRQLPYRGFPARWKKFGPSAGPKRNQQMINEIRPDIVLAFPGGKGTKGCADYAESKGIKVVRVND